MSSIILARLSESTRGWRLVLAAQDGDRKTAQALLASGPISDSDKQWAIIPMGGDPYLTELIKKTLSADCQPIKSLDTTAWYRYIKPQE